VSDYEELELDAARGKTPRDLSAVWNRLQRLEDASTEVRERVERFAAGKHFTLEALQALDARVAIQGRGPDVLLAFACTGHIGGRRVVTAVKYRNIATGKRTAETGSVFLEPTVAGDRSALDWITSEGETEGARLVDLVGDVAAVLVLPAGARTFKREWAALIPRGATVYLAHDADRDGDKGAWKAAAVLGGRTVRIRPPDGCKDWCEWPGDRDAFVRLVREAKAKARTRVKTYDELLDQYAAERSGPELEPVRLGFGTLDAELRGVSAGQVLGFAARTAVGKTWFLGSVSEHFAGRQDAGALMLSLEMPGPEWAERALAIHADVAPEEVEARARSGELGALAGPFLERMRNAVVIDEALTLGNLPDALTDARQRLTVPLRLVLVDYLGMLGSEGRDAYERASALGKGLKQIAKSESVAVVVAMQLSRQGGDGSEPVSMAMLRDSGVLEESLDFLLGAWRPGKATGLTPPEALDLRDVMRVAVLKNRKGQDGRTVDLRFRTASRRLYEPTEVA
jgi:hypothetical protein